MNGEVLKRARVKAKVGQAEIAKLCDVTQSAVSRWEHGTPIPTDKARIIAKRLGLYASDLNPDAQDAEISVRYVKGYRDALRWQREVMGSDDPMDMKFVLVSLVEWLDEKSWVVSVTRDQVIDRLEGGGEHIEEALSSPWVERFGVDYTMRLVFPEP